MSSIDPRLRKLINKLMDLDDKWTYNKTLDGSSIFRLEESPFIINLVQYSDSDNLILELFYRHYKKSSYMSGKRYDTGRIICWQESPNTENGKALLELFQRLENLEKIRRDKEIEVKKKQKERAMNELDQWLKE